MTVALSASSSRFGSRTKKRHTQIINNNKLVGHKHCYGSHRDIPYAFYSKQFSCPAGSGKNYFENNINSLIYIQRLVAKLGVKILLMGCPRE
jgi:hypothetical protein